MSLQPTRAAVHHVRAIGSVAATALDTDALDDVTALVDGDIAAGAVLLNVPASMLTRYLASAGGKADNLVVQLQLASYQELNP